MFSPLTSLNVSAKHWNAPPYSVSVTLYTHTAGLASANTGTLLWRVMGVSYAENDMFVIHHWCMSETPSVAQWFLRSSARRSCLNNTVIDSPLFCAGDWVIDTTNLVGDCHDRLELARLKPSQAYLSKSDLFMAKACV